jgi:hypothetical protein
MWQLVVFSVGVGQLQSIGVVCRGLHNGELDDLYCHEILCFKFNEGRWRWAFGVRRDGNRILVVIQDGKRQLGI